jgi:hypothetical protein
MGRKAGEYKGTLLDILVRNHCCLNQISTNFLDPTTNKHPEFNTCIHAPNESQTTSFKMQFLTLFTLVATASMAIAAPYTAFQCASGKAVMCCPSGTSDASQCGSM